MNNGWSFTKDDISKADNIKWQSISIPHTWNIDDVMDDEPGYYRAACWYKKDFVLTQDYKNKKVYLFFEGVNQEAEIFVNGKKAGGHIGGYTSFYIPISSFLKYGAQNSNQVTVKVSNAYDQNIPPLTADFTFYGGIYRNVSMVVVNKTHFACDDDHGADAVYISTPSVTNEKATAIINGVISNANGSSKKINITTSIFNKDNIAVAKKTVTQNLKSTFDQKFRQEINSIARPHLWSPGDPYLYKAVTTIADATSGKILDQIANTIGFRYFHFSADSGFFLNGKSYKLIGASRHQDFEGMGNALPKKFATNDISILKNMGANFLRVAHYPQDKAVLEACDRLGILASVEIPIVNEITQTDSFYNNCMNMQEEMICQNYNHPSVIIWGYMNEILLKPHFKNDPKQQQLYYADIVKLASSLDSLTRKEDPYRYTMMANHGNFDSYKNAGLINIPMLVGWNLYMGWYGSDITDLPEFLDNYHKQFSTKPMMITEYGADADPRIHSFNPVRFDKSSEYATYFHQYYFSEIMKRPFVTGAAVWNLADFNSETRQETMPHVNNKGLLTWNRKPKEPYYFYQSQLSKTPFVQITSGIWKNRTVIADSGFEFSTNKIKAASNLSVVELFVNKKSLGSKKVVDGFAEWTASFGNGPNAIQAVASNGYKEFRDSATIVFQIQPGKIKDQQNTFKNINVLCGTKRFFSSENESLWMPDQPYTKGSWGYVGGTPFKMKNSARTPFGTDKNITGTDDDPVYQTQQTGIKHFDFDAPKGKYELTLHFAELSGTMAVDLAYNLGDSSKTNERTKRVFDVYVNDSLVLKNFNIAEQYGVATAVAKSFAIEVKNENGIDIRFDAIEGEPVLNAVQLKKID